MLAPTRLTARLASPARRAAVMRYTTAPKDAPQPQARVNENQRASNTTNQNQSNNQFMKLLIPALIAGGAAVYFMSMADVDESVKKGLDKEITAKETAKAQDAKYQEATRAAEELKAKRA